MPKKRGFKLTKRCDQGHRLWAFRGRIMCKTDGCKNQPRVSKAHLKVPAQ